MIVLSDKEIKPGSLLDKLAKANPHAGAITSFIGQVRSEDGQVESLYLQTYPGVTEAGIAAALKRAQTRWPLCDVLIMHRTGMIAVGEIIVFIAVAAKHRRAAFEACDFLMDYLKTEAIFWKKQMGSAGSIWIEPRPQDYNDRKRWG